MMQIVGEHNSPLDGDDHLAMMRLRDTHQRQETLTGACEDDCEVTAPYIGVCPDESAHQDGSPLHFARVTHAEDIAYCEGMAEMMRLGFDYSCFMSQGEVAHRGAAQV